MLENGQLRIVLINRIETSSSSSAVSDRCVLPATGSRGTGGTASDQAAKVVAGIGRGVRLALLTLMATLAFAVPAPVDAQAVATEYEGAAATGLVLRKLGTAKRVLMIAAHPDDESTQLLSTLALGQGADVAYLSLTRGEGGQNGIGGELREGLGLLRSEELLAARRLDGARQYFTRAIDFGFSKSGEEALTLWPREELLRDVVAVIRHFRPDVIISIFTGTPRDGHGQHQAAGIMAREGFTVAGDPLRFPELQAEGLEPHTPVHLFQVLRASEDGATIAIETGALDPLLGRSHFQVAMASRSRHRSQDMGVPLTPGPQTSRLTLAATTATASPTETIFAGIDTTLSMRAATLVSTAESPDGSAGADVVALLERYEATVDAVRDGYRALHPDATVDGLVAASRLLDEASRLVPVSGDLDFLLRIDRARLDEALALTAGIRIDAVTSEEAVVPGQTFPLDLRLWNGGTRPVTVHSLEPALPPGWKAVERERLPPNLAAGQLVVRTFDVTVPPDEKPTEPYFLQQPTTGAMYDWPASIGSVGIPFAPAPVRATTSIELSGTAIADTVEASFLAVDSRSGEYRRPISVVPVVSIIVDPALAVRPLVRAGEPMTLSVTLRSEAPDGLGGELRIDAPEGWEAQPTRIPLTFTAEGEERTFDVTLRAPAGLAPGHDEVEMRFATARGAEYARGYSLVDYPHIRPRPMYRDATLEIEAIDVTVPAGMRVGYVAAAGDNVPGALTHLGVTIEPLGPSELASSTLDGFDAIVIGHRAYEGRQDLVNHNQRLLEYVRRGGTMIVQYNQYQFTEPGIAPYPVAMARPHDRVTDEDAAVRFLEPDHPVFNTPNRISDEDFEGWVQERGLYFLNTWDAAFTPLLEMSDPGEDPKRGGLVVAEYGEGMYVYTGLALFRQLAAGVPGAYRLFANLLALGAAR